MFRKLTRFLARLLLGSAERASRQVLDAHARLVMSPRALDAELCKHAPPAHHQTTPRRAPFTVIDGGLKAGVTPRAYDQAAETARETQAG
ncbi:MAG: hypothetical protein AB7E81_15590 [Hyphomicrobiaceae bacterium]